MTIHVVQAGETIGSIAAYYGVNPTQVATDNTVPASGALAVGQTLVIRFPRQVHAVQQGETLSSIAAYYGTTVRQLWRNNWSLRGGESLSPGQPLVISYFEEKLGTAVTNGYATVSNSKGILTGVSGLLILSGTINKLISSGSIRFDLMDCSTCI